MTTHRYPLPGGRATAGTRRQWLRAVLAGSYLFGPAHRSLIRTIHGKDRDALHTSEKAWANSAVTALDLKIHTRGLHHIDPDTSYMVTPLHEGFTDLLAIARLPLPMVYAATEELFDWPHLGPYLRAAHQPLISRTSGAAAYREILRAGKAASARRESLVVFPQGTLLGIEVAFRQGAFRAAEHLGMPVLPVVLTGAAGVWDYPFDDVLHFGQTISAEVLPPIAPSDAVATARTLEYEMKTRALASTPGPRRFVPERDGWWDGYRYEIDDRFEDLKGRVQQHRRSLTPASTGRRS